MLNEVISCIFYTLIFRKRHINKAIVNNRPRYFMQFFLYITDFIVPFIILAIVTYGVLMKTNVYDNFIKGAKSGFFTVIKIMPTLIGLMVAVGILRASGFLDFLSSLIGHFTAYIGFPGELVPLTIVKMFSSSAATGLLLDIFKEYGTDSRLGLIASISMACTETIFYTMSVYFMTAKIKKSRYTLPGALLATFAGLVASVLLAGMMFKGV
ncbi:spore maturation protein B [Faecalicatena orotica]|nr:nucleoside recognition domain-containing protein [Faecalicatena orotica]